MEKFNPPILCLIGSLILGGGIACQKKENRPSTAKNGLADMSDPELYMKPIHVQSFGEEGLAWELQSPIATAFSKYHVLLARDLNVITYQDGKKSTTLQAAQGIVNTQDPTLESDPKPQRFLGSPRMNAGDMYLSGDVVLISTDGTKIHTDWAHYQRKRELIVSTAPVQVIRDDSTTHGTGLEATPDLSSIQIFNQTLVIYEDEELN